MIPDAHDSSLDVRERIPCPACAEPVLPTARKCRWCGEWFGELAALGPDRERSVRLMDAGDVLNGTTIDVDEAPADPEAGPEAITQAMLRVDSIALDVGSDLVPMVNTELGGELLDRLRDVRRRIALEYGVIAPGVRCRPGPRLAAGEYQIRIKGDLIAAGSVMPGQDAVDVVATHVADVTKQHLAELLTREEVAELLNMARQDSPMVVQELVPNMLALGQLRQVLQNLVKEQVPIKDLSTILNALADRAVYTKDPYTLTEHVRQALGRRICSRYQSPDGLLRAFMLSPDAERAIQNAIQLNETGQVLMLDPTTSQAIQNSFAEALGRHRDAVPGPVVVTPPKIRRHVKSLLERHFSKIVVLSEAELVAGVEVAFLETIEARTVEDSAGADSEWLVAPACDE